MAVLSWDNVGNAANILQLLGAVHLITVAKTFLRWSQSNKECRKLELHVRGGAHRVANPMLEHTAAAASVARGSGEQRALQEANGLANSYRNGSVWFLIRRGRSMTQQFRDQRNRIDSYCALLISLDAGQLIAQARPLTAPLLVRVEGNQGSATPTAAVPSTDAEAPMAVAADGVPAHNAAADGAKRQVKVVISASTDDHPWC